VTETEAVKTGQFIEGRIEKARIEKWPTILVKLRESGETGNYERFRQHAE